MLSVQMSKMEKDKLIEKILIRGPAKRGGKCGIKMVYKSLPKKSRQRVIKDIYGTGCYGGKHIETVLYDSERLRIKKDGMEAVLTWAQVEKRISELIAQGEY